MRNRRLDCSVSHQTHHNGGVQKMSVHTTPSHVDRPQCRTKQSQMKCRIEDLVEKLFFSRNRKIQEVAAK